MKAIDVNGVIEVFNEIPNEWKNSDGTKTLGYNYEDPTIWYIDGFRDVVEPQYNSSTQYKGSIYFNATNDNFTYVVLDFTSEQIQATKTAQAQAEQLALAQTLTLNNVIAEQQQASDATALENQAIYPMWSELAVTYAFDIKVQSFDADNNLWLYKCVQPHTSQIGYNPYLTPALWTKIAPPGEVYVWVQPTGAQDAYQIGDRVHYPTITDPIYKSTVNANVYAPLVVAGQWILD
jgi:hypothetical protein